LWRSAICVLIVGTCVAGCWLHRLAHVTTGWL
jgi:hypothetical protein